MTIDKIGSKNNVNTLFRRCHNNAYTWRISECAILWHSFGHPLCDEYCCLSGIVLGKKQQSSKSNLLSQRFTLLINQIAHTRLKSQRKELAAYKPYVETQYTLCTCVKTRVGNARFQKVYFYSAVHGMRAWHMLLQLKHLATWVTIFFHAIANSVFKTQKYADLFFFWKPSKSAIT